MRRKIVRVGASLCILLPKSIIKMMGWDFGDFVDLILDEEEQQVILKNIKEPEKKPATYLDKFESFMNEYSEVMDEVDSLN